jgi:hypothetical protein
VVIALLAVWLGRPRFGAARVASAPDDDEST